MSLLWKEVPYFVYCCFHIIIKVDMPNFYQHTNGKLINLNKAPLFRAILGRKNAVCVQGLIQLDRAIPKPAGVVYIQRCIENEWNEWTGLFVFVCRFNRKDNLLRHKKTHLANALASVAKRRHTMVFGVDSMTANPVLNHVANAEHQRLPVNNISSSNNT